jgi:hypothetical protein
MMCPVSTEQSDFVYRQKEADDFLKVWAFKTAKKLSSALYP